MACLSNLNARLDAQVVQHRASRDTKQREAVGWLFAQLDKLNWTVNDDGTPVARISIPDDIRHNLIIDDAFAKLIDAISPDHRYGFDFRRQIHTYGVTRYTRDVTHYHTSHGIMAIPR